MKRKTFKQIFNNQRKYQQKFTLFICQLLCSNFATFNSGNLQRHHYDHYAIRYRHFFTRQNQTGQKLVFF